MKNLIQKIYLKIMTFFLLRKYKKLGYKFIFLFFLIIPFKVFAISTETDLGFFTGSYNGSSFSYGPQNFVSLFTNNLTVTPYVNSTTPMSLGSGSWEIRFYFLWNLQYNTPYDIKLFAGNVRATCDGTESFDVIDSFYNSSSQTYTQIMMYNCSQLDVNQNFSSFHFDFTPLSGTTNRITNFMIDRVGYGIYSSDPYEDVLDSISNNQNITNFILEDFKGLADTFFRDYSDFFLSYYDGGQLNGPFNTNWSNTFQAGFCVELYDGECVDPDDYIIAPNDESKVCYESLLDATDLTSSLAKFAACIVINHSQELHAFQNLGVSFQNTLTSLMADYLARTLSDVSDVSYQNRDAVFLLESTINSWADFDDVDWSELDYQVNSNANNFILTMISDYVTINDKITGFVITMLSLGVVGLILHRRGG